MRIGPQCVPTMCNVCVLHIVQCLGPHDVSSYTHRSPQLNVICKCPLCNTKHMSSKFMNVKNNVKYVFPKCKINTFPPNITFICPQNVGQTHKVWDKDSSSQCRMLTCLQHPIPTRLIANTLYPLNNIFFHTLINVSWKEHHLNHCKSSSHFISQADPTCN